MTGKVEAEAVPMTSKGDERVRKVSTLNRLLSRPELGAVSGTILVFLFFAIVAWDSGMFNADGIMNWTTVSAQLGIIAVGACLLMIAGEFDLSIGSMIGFAGMMIAIPSVYWGWPVWLAIIFAFVGAMAIGFVNGYIVVKTGLPSFIVSLAFLFILRGLTIALSIMLTNKTILSGVSEVAEGDILAAAFGGQIGTGFFQWLANIGLIETYSDGSPIVSGIPMVVVWWFLITAVCSFVLLRTRFGNWIFAAGGDANAAKNVGVPTEKVKISLFMFTAFCATVFAACQVLEFGSAAADRGLLKEFEAIIAAVIGGALLTGGYGSVIGAFFGALIFGVVQMGIFFTGVDSDWFRVFLGVMLLIAVLFNNFIRKKVTNAR
ncbi:putative Ribose/xylose/arabinose/galactoside ABC-type transport system, permease component [Vibrio nigripulchritudo MADA3029]|uniref:Xylose transport system permease protein XylH n=2 Tax=Vibrio nigripulchritudo TaxID=28173 RepID=U4JZ46_9VIBR|nr:ABC transporter permease [Vibrio nigripulchritudo]CCN50380.1 putative Ribose/xylose/arabinose/galactoside ABC-type transport system, permease component [Vibrio nigripulchritudo MADA3020]CCN52331.1 putative Ribose/xylose/arabinose/galactoside ABC-type transport system, permease component [Vibrio nigripulchritudo MADA3021]CCN62157.1 putative Ribose/xylose/arabinose/galactoside ABC-type transport system, permease component [Vibrio nigripulchritudo MADA3029]CCN69484.1 putative Ribose/xylose/arab